MQKVNYICFNNMAKMLTYSGSYPRSHDGTVCEQVAKYKGELHHNLLNSTPIGSRCHRYGIILKTGQLRHQKLEICQISQSFQYRLQVFSLLVSLKRFPALVEFIYHFHCQYHGAAMRKALV